MRIVIRGTNWIGDSVMSVPAIRQVRRLFPDAHIALHTRSWAEGIYRDSELFNEIISFNATGSKAASTMRQASVLREQKFDLSILLPNSFATAFVARLANIKRRFGYSTDGRGFLLSDTVKVPAWKTRRHEVYYYLNLVAELETKLLGTRTTHDIEPKIDIRISDERRVSARRFLAEHGVDLSRKTVALTPGSTNSRAKRWPAKSFAELNDKLQREIGLNVVILGSPDEREVSSTVVSASTIKPFDLTGKTSLGEVAAILSEVDLLIANDMGLAHLAPAVGTETLVIFGPTNPVTTRPFSDLSQVVRVDVECSPCMLRDCPIDHRCMTRITPEDVFAQAARKLKRI